MQTCWPTPSPCCLASSSEFSRLALVVLFYDLVCQYVHNTRGAILTAVCALQRQQCRGHQKHCSRGTVFPLSSSSAYGTPALSFVLPAVGRRGKLQRQALSERRYGCRSWCH